MRVFKDDCKLRKLNPGDAFWYEDELHILTGEYLGYRLSVCLTDGLISYIDDDTLVRKERNAAVLCQPLS